MGAIKPTKRKKTAREIAAKLDVSERTVRRYIALPRTEYEANSISRAKPWEVLGMSRATWYSKGKPTSIIPKIKKTQPWEVLGISRTTWYRKGKPLPVSREINDPDHCRGCGCPTSGAAQN